jgi:hypothetical protein
MSSAANRTGSRSGEDFVMGLAQGRFLEISVEQKRKGGRETEREGGREGKGKPPLYPSIPVHSGATSSKRPRQPPPSPSGVSP